MIEMEEMEGNRAKKNEVERIWEEIDIGALWIIKMGKGKY